MRRQLCLTGVAKGRNLGKVGFYSFYVTWCDHHLVQKLTAPRPAWLEVGRGLWAKNPCPGPPVMIRIRTG